MTYFLMLTLLEVLAIKNYSTIAGLPIVLTVTGIILFGAPISGALLNPATSFATALVSGIEQHFRFMALYQH